MKIINVILNARLTVTIATTALMQPLFEVVQNQTRVDVKIYGWTTEECVVCSPAMTFSRSQVCSGVVHQP